MPNSTKIEVQNILNMCRDKVTESSRNNLTQPLENQDLFSLGAQLLYFGQRLTEISQWKLDPASAEGKNLLIQLAEELDKSKACTRCQTFAHFMSEPEEV